MYFQMDLLVLPILVMSITIFGICSGLTEYEILKLCEGKNMEIIAYPGSPHNFIVCLNENTQVGFCRHEIDKNNPTEMAKTCFGEKEQSCSLDYCPTNNPESDYAQFVKQFCNDDRNWLQTLPAEDCEHYYVCLGSGNAVVYESCPDGYHFSRMYKSCRPLVEAGCETLDNLCVGKKDGYSFASGTCYKYYECQSFKPRAKSCPYGQHYDVISKNCIDARQSECVDHSQRIPKCTINDNGVYFRHEKCNKFYVCVNTVPLEAQCPQDFFFDEKNQLCRKDNKGVCVD